MFGGPELKGGQVQPKHSGQAPGSVFGNLKFHVDGNAVYQDLAILVKRQFGKQGIDIAFRRCDEATDQ